MTSAFFAERLGSFNADERTSIWTNWSFQAVEGRDLWRTFRQRNAKALPCGSYGAPPSSAVLGGLPPTPLIISVWEFLGFVTPLWGKAPSSPGLRFGPALAVAGAATTPGLGWGGAKPPFTTISGGECLKSLSVALRCGSSSFSRSPLISVEGGGGGGDAWECVAGFCGCGCGCGERRRLGGAFCVCVGINFDLFLKRRLMQLNRR